MSKIAVLTEKPSVGRDIARVLNCNKKGNGYFEGDKYIVTWALGHLVTLEEPENIDIKYKTWDLESLPMLPNKLKLTIMKQTSKQFYAVKQVLERSDVEGCIIGTDAGREGELVARWILEKLKYKKNIQRLWISSVTDKAIKDGFNNLKPGKQYENLYASAVARAEADWYIGLNATRALTTKFNAQLNCGRVQTPTLAIIDKREQEINHFKVQNFYGLEAKTDKLNLTWMNKQNQTRMFDSEVIKAIMDKCDKRDAKVTEIQSKPNQLFAPALYDLTELQRDANKFYGYSAKETLNIMQKLYEQHKVLTYPRTDSRYLSSDIYSTISERIKACAIGEFSAIGNQILKQGIPQTKAVFDNSKVSDHHAIIPTEQYVQLSAFSDKERKIYQLVVKRFMSVFLPAYKYEQITLKADIAGETFIAKGKVELESGWKQLYQQKNDEHDEEVAEQRLPKLKQGDVLEVKYLAQTTGKTKPPGRFTEATLLSAMENPAKYMDEQNQVLANTLKATGGLGTVATRADIIEKLFSSFMIELKGKEIYVTPKGKQLLELVPPLLKSPETTAQWELKLEEIAKGKINKNQFIQEIMEHTKDIVSDIKQLDKQYKHHNMTSKTCPDCGKKMLEVNGKKGKMLVCQDRECGHRQSISRVTNSRCPNCHKKLNLIGEGEGQQFVCSCGHKEKMSSFKDRKQKESNQKVDKKTLKKYMNQEAEPVNNAFADLLKNLDLK